MNTLEFRFRRLLHVMSELREAACTMQGMYFDRDGSIQRAIDESLQAEDMAEQALLDLDELISVICLINVDKDGDGFICREAMDCVLHTISLIQATEDAENEVSDVA